MTEGPHKFLCGLGLIFIAIMYVQRCGETWQIPAIGSPVVWCHVATPEQPTRRGRSQSISRASYRSAMQGSSPVFARSNRRLRGTRDDLSAARHAAQKLGGVACAGGGGRGAVASHVYELSLR